MRIENGHMVVVYRNIPCCSASSLFSLAMAPTDGQGRTRPRLGSGGHAMAVTRVLRTPLQADASTLEEEWTGQGGGKVGRRCSLPSSVLPQPQLHCVSAPHHVPGAMAMS
ncbi:unnamed protein product [Durusdinium trenchii]|uniref:Uncharacterized protein n=1 Tax=Durusdinium trenchii TaxID=1381693 RepID=A0ABP0N515_9DINO